MGDQVYSLHVFVDDRNFNFNDVHVTAAKRIAEAVVKYNVSRLIHVSSYNAQPTSESQFYASKVLAYSTYLILGPRGNRGS
jgi:hypothetical protein